MTWETARRAVDLCLAETISRAAIRRRQPIAQLGYFGGEPLLQWKLLQRSAEYAMEEGERLGIVLKKTVTTNMTLLDEGKSTWLREHGFHVGLSLDGTAERHDLLRKMANGSPSHSACSSALRFFHGPSARCVLILVVDPRNVRGLAESLEWLVNQEMFEFILNPNYYTDWDDAALAVWRSEILKIGDIYLASFRAGRPIRIDVFDSKIEAHIANPLHRCEQCGFGGSEVAISPGGTLYPCVRIVADPNRTNLRIGHVSGGFDSAKLREIAPSGGPPSPECVDCPARNRCENWCACVNLGTTGDVNRVSGLLCFHERMVIETADHVASLLFAEANPSFLQRFYRHPHPAR